MKNLKRKVAVAMANATKKAAIIGSGAASLVGLYQPKVPQQLQK